MIETILYLVLPIGLNVILIRRDVAGGPGLAAVALALVLSVTHSFYHWLTGEVSTELLSGIWITALAYMIYCLIAGLLVQLVMGKRMRPDKIG